MNKLVIDASVAIKWYTREEHREKALRLREAHINGELTLTAPNLLAYEVINALRSNPSLTPGDLEDAVEALFMLGIELEPPTRESMISLARAPSAKAARRSETDSIPNPCKTSTCSSLRLGRSVSISIAFKPFPPSDRLRLGPHRI